MATSSRTRKPPKTWSLLGEVKRKPTPYEVVTSKFQYHFRREGSPFEHPNMPLNQWYLDHREGSPLQVESWEEFRDPYRLTYKDYVSLQHERETYVDKLIDRAEERGLVAEVDPEWVSTLAEFILPGRFAIHVLQMTGLYVGQMSPSAFISNCANFSAADELRRIQRLAYWTKTLANAHDESLATTERARTAWESNPAWQPARELLERLLIAYDWGEAFAVRNLLVKPALDQLLNVKLGELAAKNGDEFFSMLLAEFTVDSRRSEEWSTALVRYALDSDAALRDQINVWLSSWQGLIDNAVAALAPVFEKAPEPISAGSVIESVADSRNTLLANCGLIG